MVPAYKEELRPAKNSSNRSAYDGNHGNMSALKSTMHVRVSGGTVSNALVVGDCDFDIAIVFLLVEVGLVFGGHGSLRRNDGVRGDERNDGTSPFKLSISASLYKMPPVQSTPSMIATKIRRMLPFAGFLGTL